MAKLKSDAGNVVPRSVGAVRGKLPLARRLFETRLARRMNGDSGREAMALLAQWLQG